MRCDEVVRELAAPTVDRDRAAMAEHLAACPACAGWARRAEQLDRLWDATRPAEPSPEAWDAVWANIVQALPAQRRRIGGERHAPRRATAAGRRILAPVRSRSPLRPRGGSRRHSPRSPWWGWRRPPPFWWPSAWPGGRRLAPMARGMPRPDLAVTPHRAPAVPWRSGCVPGEGRRGDPGGPPDADPRLGGELGSGGSGGTMIPGIGGLIRAEMAMARVVDMTPPEMNVSSDPGLMILNVMESIATPQVAAR